MHKTKAVRSKFAVFYFISNANLSFQKSSLKVAKVELHKRESNLWFLFGCDVLYKRRLFIDIMPFDSSHD